MILNISGKEVLIDDEDYDKIKDKKLYIKEKRPEYFCVCFAKWKKEIKNNTYIILARYLLNINNKKIDIDHKNGNPLDNRRNNLRICNRQQNSFNQKISKNNTSGYKGVYYRKRERKYVSRIMKNYKYIFLGYFNDKIKAAAAYNNAAIKLFGEFARLNKIKNERK